MPAPDDVSNEFLILPRSLLEVSEIERTTGFGAGGRAKLERAASSPPPKKALDRVGLTPSDLRQERSARTPGRGKYRVLQSLGITTVEFMDDTERYNTLNELGKDYELVPNCRMELVPPTPPEREKDRDPRQWGPESGVEEAHNRGITGAGVIVGTLDSGIDADHDEFADKNVVFRYYHLRVDSPRDIRGFDSWGHGTHVCGIIGGRNCGVAPGVELHIGAVIHEVHKEYENCLLTDLVRVSIALNWLQERFNEPHNRNKPKVLNLSLQFPEARPEDTTRKGQLEALRAALTEMRRTNRVLPIVAIGNEKNQYRYPGAFKEVIGVGAVDFDKNIWENSGHGTPPGEEKPKPDVVGYGIKIYSGEYREYSGASKYCLRDGTSQATPYVAGIAALYWSANPSMSVDDVEQKLLDTALPLSPREKTGAGLVRFVP